MRIVEPAYERLLHGLMKFRVLDLVRGAEWYASGVETTKDTQRERLVTKAQLSCDERTAQSRSDGADLLSRQLRQPMSRT